MALYLRSTTVAAAGLTLAGAAAYAVYKTGALRPVMITTIKTGMKVTDWTEKQYDKAKKRFKGLVAEAKKETIQEAKSAKA